MVVGAALGQWCHLASSGQPECELDVHFRHAHASWPLILSGTSQTETNNEDMAF